MANVTCNQESTTLST